MSATTTTTLQQNNAQHRVPASGAGAKANSTNGGVATNATNSTNAVNGGTAASPLDATEVAWLFTKKYYTVLNENPNILHQFYRKQSVLCHGVEGKTVPSYNGQAHIAKRLKEHNFQDCRVVVSNMDCQDSLDGGVVIQVLGEMANNGRASQKFAQTFFLAPQEPQGYFVLNDIFRFLKEDADDEEEVDEPQPQPQSQTQHKAPSPVAAAPQTVAKAAQPQKPTEVQANGQVRPEQKAPLQAPAQAAVQAPAQTPAQASPASTQGQTVAKTAETKVEKTDTKPETKSGDKQAEVPKAQEAKTAANKTQTPVQAKPEANKVEAKTTTAPPVTKKAQEPTPSMSWASIAKKKETESAAAKGTTATKAPVAAHSTTTGTTATASTPSAPVNTASRVTPLQNSNNNSNIVVTTRPGQVAGRKDYHSAYIRDVNMKINEELLRKGLEAIGQLTHFQVEKEKNRAFVDFVDAPTLKAALAVHELKVGDQVVFIEERKRGGAKKNGGPKKVYKNKP